MVEFALVIPLFLAILTAIVEFAFSFNAVLATQYASRDAALVAAEAGNGEGSDCVILATVDSDMGARRTRADHVGRDLPHDGGRRAGRRGHGLGPHGHDRLHPARRLHDDARLYPHADGYPEASRCNVLAGCDGRGLDHIGVQVNYRYEWKTPLATGSATTST